MTIPGLDEALSAEQIAIDQRIAAELQKTVNIVQEQLAGSVLADRRAILAGPARS